MVEPIRRGRWAALGVAGLVVSSLTILGGPLPALADSGSPPGFLSTIGGPGHATIYPGGAELTPDGGIVIADTGNDRVAKYSTSGALIWSAGSTGTGNGQFRQPRDVGVDSSGDIFVADDGNGRMVKLDAGGNWLLSWRNSGTDRMGAPIGVTVTNNLVYVADGVQKAVRVFDTAGNELHKFSSNGICTFSRVRDADADAAGNVYIADYLNDDILKLDSAGQCVTKWGSKGSGPGQFLNPYGVRIATDPVLGRQAVFVADSNNERIQEFELNGTYVTSIGSSGTKPGTFTQLRRVAVDAGGNVWGSDLWGYRVEEFTRSASGYTYAQTIGGVPPPLAPGAMFNQPHGIAWDPAGNMTVVDTVNQRLIQLSPSGAILGACGQRGFKAGEENWPRGVAIDQSTGNLWIADTKQSNIEVLKPGCTQIYKFGTQGPGQTQFYWPYSIAIRQTDGTAWIADTFNNRIISYSVATRRPIEVFGALGAGSGQFSRPSAIAISPSNGHVLVADARNRRIVELSDTGGAGIAVVRTLTDGFRDPEGVAADAQGRIYVADTRSSRVVILNPDGSELGTITSGINQPENLAISPAGQLYVANTHDDNVLVYAYPAAAPTISAPPAQLRTTSLPAASPRPAPSQAAAPALASAIGAPSYVGTLVGPGLASMYPVAATYTSARYYVMDAGRYRVVAVNRATGNIDFQTSSTQGFGPGQFSDARAIGVDSAGDVYVADTANNRIEKFDAGLNYLGQWGSKGTGPSQFNQAYGIAIGPGLDGAGLPAEVVYVVDGGSGGNGRVEKFDLNGGFISQFGSGLLVDPRQITVDPLNKYVYMINARRHQVIVFDDSGTYVMSFGRQGIGPGEFSGDPRGVALTPDGNWALATDSGGKRVLVFNARTGAYQAQIGGPGTGPGQFTNPRGITLTADDQLLVTDEFGFGLDEFNLTEDGSSFSSSFVQKLFGTPPPLPGVNTPRAVRVVPGTGRVIMVDYWNQRVQSINPDGSSPQAFGERGTANQDGAVNFAWDLAIQPSTGWLYLANRESHQVEVFHQDGTYVTKWGKRGTAPGQFQFPQGITFAPDGTLLIADSGNGRIERFSIDAGGNGTLLAVYGQKGSARKGTGFLDVPTGITTAPDGTIWVADTLNNSVQSMSPGGTWTRFSTPAGGSRLRAPWGVALAPDGNLWISDTGNGRIVSMTPAGAQNWAANGTDLGVGGSITPFGLDFGLGNHVYLSDVWHNRVIDLVHS